MMSVNMKSNSYINEFGQLVELSDDNSELQSKIDSLENELIELIAKRDIYLFISLPKIEHEYFRVFGKRKLELFNREIDVLKLKKTIGYVQSYMKLNQKPDITVIAVKVANEMKEWTYRAESFKKRIELVEALNKDYKVDPADWILEIYKQIIRYFFPEINPGYPHYWAELYSTWQSHEYEKLSYLFEKYSSELESKKKLEDTAAFNNEIKRYTLLIERMKIDIETLEGEFPLMFRDKVFDRAWVNKENTELDEQIENFNLYKRNLENYLEQILEKSSNEFYITN